MSDAATVDFIPLVYPSAAIGKKMSVDPRKWHAWEFSLRAFTGIASHALAQRTATILAAPCVCYDVVHANAPAFNPIARTAASRLRAFRRATLRMLPPHAGVASDAMLWVVRRHALRNIANDAELSSTLAADPTLARRVQRGTPHTK